MNARATDSSLYSKDLLESKARQLHQKLFVPIILYSLAYTTLNWVLGMNEHALATFALIPSVLVSRFLDGRGHILISKIWTFFSINIILYFLALVSVHDSYSYLFFFPLAIGAYIIFHGKERYYSYIFSFLSFLGMIAVVVIDFNQWSIFDDEMTNPLLERVLNILGSFFFIMMEVIFIIRLNESIQNDLLENKVALDNSNMQLKSSVYARDQILSMIAHDIRSPLATIYGLLDLVDSNTLDAEELRALKKSIKEKSDATIQMVNDVLKWSLTENSIITYRPVDMGVKEVSFLLKTVCVPYDELIVRGEIDCDKETDWKGIVRIDRVMMEAVLRNLLSNAIKFTGNQRKIKLSVFREENQLCFSVRDNGTGIPQENLEKLRQGVAFTTNDERNPKGVGLGNQIVIDFLSKHGAQLIVESEMGKGSEFKFYLPLIV